MEALRLIAKGFTSEAAGKKTKDDQEKTFNESIDETKRGERNFDSEIRELFRLFDTNNDRSISAQELGKAMKFLGMSPTEDEVSEAMFTLDVNGNGRIEFQEFYSFMQTELSKICTGEFTNKEEVIRSAFRTFDKDGSGYLDSDKLRKAMKTLGDCLTDTEIEDMIKHVDRDDNGKIKYEEFVKIWCETSYGVIEHKLDYLQHFVIRF